MPTIEARLSLHPRRALELLRETRRLRRAAKAIPKPMPWDWAKPRLMPLLAGPYLGDPLVTLVDDLGCALNFGVEIKGTYLLVDREVAERWECSAEQLNEIARANLDARAGRLGAGSLTHGTLSGRVVRLFDRVPWGSSLVLAPTHLVRIFGGQDQVFGVPRRGMLLSLPLATPTHVVADIVVDAEERAAFPLMLDPFVLVDGRVLWDSGAVDDPLA